MTVVIFFMTTQLVLGYSWQDMHLPPLSVAGKGFEVAWVSVYADFAEVITNIISRNDSCLSPLA